MPECICCFQPCSRQVVCVATRMFHNGYYLCSTCEAEWTQTSPRCMVCNQTEYVVIHPCSFVSACCITLMWGAFLVYLCTLVLH